MVTSMAFESGPLILSMKYSLETMVIQKSAPFGLALTPMTMKKKNLPLMPLLIVLKIAITPQISVPTMLPILLHFLNGRSDIL